MAVALTTVDNPYDPFNDFDKWFQFDIEHGYYTCGLLDRIANTSDQFTDEENEEMLEESINEFLKLDFTGIYKKVYAPEGAA